MITLLNSAGGQPGAPGAAALGPFTAEARALIGFFSLDPNRCAALCSGCVWWVGGCCGWVGAVDGWVLVVEGTLFGVLV